MPTQAYYVGERKPSNRVPSVTTVLRKWGDPGGLINWAWNMGAEGVSLNEARQKAITPGNIAHAMIEAWYGGDVPEAEAVEADATEEQLDYARQGFEAFMAWESGLQLQPLFTEHGLVHPEHRYGGCLDFLGMGKVHGEDKLVLCDWKLAGGTYAEHVLQLAAYRELVERNMDALRELTPLELPDRVQLTYSLRFGKEHGDFHHHAFTRSQVDHALRQFLLIREAYELDYQTSKWCR